MGNSLNISKPKSIKYSLVENKLITQTNIDTQKLVPSLVETEKIGGGGL